MILQLVTALSTICSVRCIFCLKSCMSFRSVLSFVSVGLLAHGFAAGGASKLAPRARWRLMRLASCAARSFTTFASRVSCPLWMMSEDSSEAARCEPKRRPGLWPTQRMPPGDDAGTERTKTNFRETTNQASANHWQRSSFRRHVRRFVPSALAQLNHERASEDA
jgi:hypothetical protein